MHVPRTADRLDLVAGALLLVLGVFVIWESGHYGMGRMANIGPGFFPRVLGVVLAFAGAGTILGALGRQGSVPALRLRVAAAVGGALLAFALLIEPFGIVPATVALTIVARFAEPRPNILHVLVLSLGLSALCAAVFVWGLNLPLSLVKLP